MAQKRKKKETRIKRDNNIRVPRPLGTTMRSLTIHQEPDQKTKERRMDELKQYTLDQYISQGMQLNGKIYSLNEISNYLGWGVERTMIRVNKTMARIGGALKGQDGHEFARVLFFQAIQKSLEIQAYTQSHALTLLAQQGEQYVPFLSSEVSKALKVWMDSQHPVKELLKIITDTKSGTSFSPLGLPETSTNSQYLGTDEALQIVSKNYQTMLQNPLLLETKIGQLPTVEVRANYQDLTSIGIKGTVAKVAEPIGLVPTNLTEPNIPNEVLEAEDFKG